MGASSLAASLLGLFLCNMVDLEGCWVQAELKTLGYQPAHQQPPAEKYKVSPGSQAPTRGDHHESQLHRGENERIRLESSRSILPGVRAPRIINHWPSGGPRGAQRRSSRHMKVNVKSLDDNRPSAVVQQNRPFPTLSSKRSTQTPAPERPRF